MHYRRTDRGGRSFDRRDDRGGFHQDRDRGGFQRDLDRERGGFCRDSNRDGSRRDDRAGHHDRPYGRRDDTPRWKRNGSPGLRGLTPDPEGPRPGKPHTREGPSGFPFPPP
ncbi:hypothetical protein [Streptomyces jeddahensis]|uniref:RNA helicase n=1 Tax=Streptomyces jeddahensis TaxID=1716141 RepID=A0A177HWX2_9ACTN|nr:hypothetical protein [Streptomyces jeddahensis]OAH15402.1 hypothetical protein STSP_11730 [Streptomyces jeddahensis]